MFVRLFRQCLIITLAALSMPSMAGNDNIHYFAKLAGVITPLLEYRPRGEIDAEQAKALRHYRVTYDNQGRLTSMAFYQGDTPLSAAYYSAHEVRYSYHEQGHDRRYYDENGQPATMWRHYYQSQNVHHEAYRKSGNKVELTLYGLDGEPVSVGTGSAMFRAEYIAKDQFIQRQFKTDGSANIIFEYLPFEQSLITVDSNDHLYQIIYLDPQSLKRANHPTAGFAEMRLHFDEFGNELGWDFRDIGGQLANRASNITDGGYAQWQYKMTWQDRRLGQYTMFEESYQTADGKPFCKASGVCRVGTFKDELGNFTGWQFLNKNGELIVDPDAGFARIDIERDEHGRRLAISYFGDDNGLRKTGVAVSRFSYDEAGNAIETQFDHQGQPIQPEDEAAP
ncbi:hypothetical protein P2G88_14015 [Aliiglaciecola sp. CAU 1673]|uniref:hypothetical protein n=1 Tax=Aliiglaciecola sp. CAU 1673 TaxID=3032595 RepID=UPI0023DCA432|nr:hypothetical protein [Aliiglaciecola sp. CAU 1673]MDF2179370.1 hypothetical protein [Aliiglaciecola sp. CAU 1673]